MKKSKTKLKRLKKKRKSFLGGSLVLGMLVIAVIVWITRDIPNPSKLSSGDFPESSQILDRNGKLIYEIYTDKRRQEVELESIPEKLVLATLAIEDAGFYGHFGFDVKGIIRGLYRTIVERRLQGGST